MTGLSVLMAACGSGGGDGGGQPAAGQSGGTGALAKVGDVPVGGGVVSEDGVLVLQLTEGKFTAFDAICPHQSFRVSPPDANGIITCRGHDSHFRAADGSFIDGPAPKGLKPVQVQVKEGYVVKIAG
ncbi:MAG TPA: Rieske (2Fe-2S) protein [Candidatus Limnocylindrales bacterium]|nr:Rieske (2Fe-2S) protein [Candidatus Limnocylindrales bacterium]